MTDYPYHTATYAAASYSEDGATEVLPCKSCQPGRPCARFRGVFDPFPDTDATMFIQWKGTDVCLDFTCPCGADGHFDGDFPYFLRCPSCGSVYEMGTQVKARLLAPEEHAWLLPDGGNQPQDLDIDRNEDDEIVVRVRPEGHAVVEAPQ